MGVSFLFFHPSIELKIVGIKEHLFSGDFSRINFEVVVVRVLREWFISVNSPDSKLNLS